MDFTVPWKKHAMVFNLANKSVYQYHQLRHTCWTMTFNEACQEKEETSGVMSGL